MDVDNEKIYINPFNQELLNYSVSFVDIYIAVEFAYAMATTKEDMKQYLLQLLGRNFPNTKDYFGPLSDELMRMKRSR